jgi:DnaK suppressor protein
MVQSFLAPSLRQRPIGPGRPARRLSALREELERQRDFRTEQLGQLFVPGDSRAAPVGSPPRARDGDEACALQEIRAMVAAGARQALADIELALARMDDGTYGRCRVCDAGIPPAVLTAIPATTVCPSCRRADAASA